MDETFDLIIKDGKKFSNLRKLFGDRVCWASKEMEWSDDNIPDDLKIMIRLTDGTHVTLEPNDNEISL